ncbi:MAG TPA: hypothetical protein VFG14_02075 [Chthoniobacteraceae bacterium]|nr:hypothetical protein [Chthoniobacteraceae bacterium]
MIYRDQFSGQLHEFGGLGCGCGCRRWGTRPRIRTARVIFDGLGNPVGILPALAALAPLAAKAAAFALPALKSLIPMAASALPSLMSRFQPSANTPPPSSPEPAPLPTPAPIPVAPLPVGVAPTPVPPTQLTPVTVATPSGVRVVYVRRPRRRRRAPVRIVAAAETSVPAPTQMSGQAAW